MKSVGPDLIDLSRANLERRTGLIVKGDHRKLGNPPMAGFLISDLTDDKIILMGWFCTGLSTTGFIVLNFSHYFAGNGCKR
jgi:hypothetical protein